MAIRSILTQVHAAGSGPARLKFAADLAASLGAELIGVGVQAFMPYVTSAGAFGFVDGAAVQAVRDEIDREIEAAHVLFTETLAAAKVHGEWHSAVDDPAEVIARLARGADLVIATRHEPSLGSAAIAFASDLLMETGRPLLVIPPDPKPLKIGTVVVAWKDSREARRAFGDCLPLIEKAEEVVVLEICGDDETGDASLRTESVVRHLTRHGIKARARVVKHTEGRVSEELLREATAIGADLVVAGAYAHSRMREWVLGGVTQDLLEGAPLPCFLSH